LQTAMVRAQWSRSTSGTLVQSYLPQGASPFDSEGATAETGVTLGEGDTTDVLKVTVGEVLDLFVIERRRGCTVGCIGGCIAIGVKAGGGM
jgi:hypothetical protein